MTQGALQIEPIRLEAENIVRLIQSSALPLRGEKRLQEEISNLLTSHNIEHDREWRLSDEDIVDFRFASGLVMEVKLKAPKRAIYRQCERYCKHSEVNALILATATATGFPPDINDKPCWVASLGSGWL